MYAGDSFFTLDRFGQAGLIVLSLALALFCLVIVDRLARAIRAQNWLLRLSIGLSATWITFWLFLWLSPQIYYIYYTFIMNGLPAQIVIKHPLNVPDLIEILLFERRPTLADHGRGILGWLMMAFAIVRLAEDPVLRPSKKPAGPPEA